MLSVSWMYALSFSGCAKDLMGKVCHLEVLLHEGVKLHEVAMHGRQAAKVPLSVYRHVHHPLSKAAGRDCFISLSSLHRAWVSAVYNHPGECLSSNLGATQGRSPSIW